MRGENGKHSIWQIHGWRGTGGDIPNIWVAADGSAGYEAFTTLTTGASLMDEDGSAIIIHENEDDHLTQPIGGAGARVACGALK